jgi:AraC-like DNA-binding protein
MAGAAAYLCLSGPWSLDAGPAVRLALIAATATIPFTLWCAAHAAFEDGFRTRIWHIALAAAVALAAACLEFAGPVEPLGRNLLRLLGIAAVAHAVWRIARGVPTDLVERRRRMRFFLVVALAMFVIASLAVELALTDPAAREPLEPLSAITIFVLTTVLGAATITRSMARPSARPAGGGAAGAVRPPEDRPPEGGAEAALVRRVREAAGEGVLWETGLTVGGLAARLDAPEYRLRRAINRELGYRNFNAFLNAYRVDEAKRRLVDPRSAALPVLTVAMDLGYGSIGPFNRAFREATGMSPTEYRHSHGPENRADS